jgi:CheY-like chemotaxis protein
VAVAELEPDLVVLDIAMPGVDGLAVAERLRHDHPDVRVLFLSMHDDDGSLQRAAGPGRRRVRVEVGQHRAAARGAARDPRRRLLPQLRGGQPGDGPRRGPLARSTASG